MPELNDVQREEIMAVIDKVVSQLKVTPDLENLRSEVSSLEGAISIAESALSDVRSYLGDVEIALSELESDDAF